ncbi:putative disease resistance protein RGA3 [Durio zibethinus]|uniref:Disease resistance protein RGA3 n=1 Tax=Durio zibethinus TaxID=66656 RepID=A0A6P5WUA0_DURZI|nr:putative disease resistance protein RGA3 [Durio zibethinus]
MLKLSYNHLPSHLQRCLTRLSLFPKDTIYDTDYIVQFWMAIGLTESPKQNEEWEDVGLQYFKELWSLGFVQDVEVEYTYYTFKIHDLIHDLLSNVSQDDCLTIYLHTINTADHIRHLSFSGDNPLRAPQSFLKNLNGVRTLVILPSSGRNRIIEEHFVNASILNFKFLRLLDLFYSFLEVLPNSVGTLKHLRYLDLSRCYRMSKFPRSIYKRQSLLTLRLLDIDCQLQLPRNLQSLVNLSSCTATDQLEIRGAPKLEDLPRLLLDRSASTLQLIKIHRCPNFEILPEWLQNLSSLQKLEILDCPKLSSLPDGLDRLTLLTQLQIRKCPTLSEKYQPEVNFEVDALSLCANDLLASIMDFMEIYYKIVITLSSLCGPSKSKSNTIIVLLHLSLDDVSALLDVNILGIDPLIVSVPIFFCLSCSDSLIKRLSHSSISISHKFIHYCLSRRPIKCDYKLNRDLDSKAFLTSTILRNLIDRNLINLLGSGWTVNSSDMDELFLFEIAESVLEKITSLAIEEVRFRCI